MSNNPKSPKTKLASMESSLGSNSDTLTPSQAKRRAIVGAVSSLGALSAVGVSTDVAAQAASFPNKPIRLIVPFPPGGGTDAFARPLAKILTQQLGQTVVIDNKGGAGGTLGMDMAAKSAADGYTLIMGAVHHTIAVSMYPRLPYNLQKDMMPLTAVAFVPNVVVVNAERMPVKDIGEFMRAIKGSPGKYNYASVGNGTTQHLCVEMYKTMTKTFSVHVPYRGAGPALADLMAGQVDFMFDGLAGSMPHIKSGKIVPLAVTTAQRSPALPNLPTLQEAGVKGYEARTWYGLWAPVGVPKEIAAKLNAEIKKAMGTKEIKDAWAALGAEMGGEGPEVFTKLIDGEIKRWAKVVKDSGAKLD
jgi:tripartite-type tricarboxylate transporter receptor subunit TctC